MRLPAVAALLILAAAPALAEPPPPPGPGHAGHPMPFSSMSEAGRRTMMMAMAPRGNADRGDHERVKAARDRMLTLLEADRLDTAALRRAMDEERDAAGDMRAHRQTAMLAALQNLSLADRRAFVADARQMRGRFEKGMGKRWRRGGPGGPGGPDGMPPPM